MLTVAASIPAAENFKPAGFYLLCLDFQGPRKDFRGGKEYLNVVNYRNYSDRTPVVLFYSSIKLRAYYGILSCYFVCIYCNVSDKGGGVCESVHIFLDGGQLKLAHYPTTLTTTFDSSLQREGMADIHIITKPTSSTIPESCFVWQIHREP